MRKSFVLACFIVASCGNSAALAPSSGPAADGRTATLDNRVSGTNLVSAETQGMSRVCVYRPGPGGTESRVHRVGLGQQCPLFHPTRDGNFPVPPAARLESAQLGQDGRNCVYESGSGRWVIQVPLTRNCPLSAGQVRSEPSEESVPVGADLAPPSDDGHAAPSDDSDEAANGR